MFTEKEFKELENELEISMEPAKTGGQNADNGIIGSLLCLGFALVIVIGVVRGIAWIISNFVG